MRESPNEREKPPLTIYQLPIAIYFTFSTATLAAAAISTGALSAVSNHTIDFLVRATDDFLMPLAETEKMAYKLWLYALGGFYRT